MKELLLTAVRDILIRDLNKLEQELRQYPTESQIWKVEPGITNPAGNLTLHLCGNLQYYIGAVLGNTGYIRNRDLEFAAKDKTRADLLTELERTRTAVASTLPALSEAQLQSEYPIDVFGKPMKTLYFLIHLTAHFSYHLGQVNYHRRLVG
ncbi:MAG TPA: DinB family protein [Cyclobacteriaceae bacterium]|nr:DinB family protein [Cyclobacteriaceae bacterium]